jgi:hypothetical protein
MAGSRHTRRGLAVWCLLLSMGTSACSPASALALTPDGCEAGCPCEAPEAAHPDALDAPEPARAGPALQAAAPAEDGCPEGCADCGCFARGTLGAPPAPRALVPGAAAARPAARPPEAPPCGARADVFRPPRAAGPPSPV